MVSGFRELSPVKPKSKAKHAEVLLVDSLVSDFTERGKPQDEFELILEGCLGFLRLTAASMKSRKKLPFSLDDLVSAGSGGLALGIRRYEHIDGAEPSSYLGIKIRGAILDWIRTENPVPKAAYGRGERNVSLEEAFPLKSPGNPETTVIWRNALEWACTHPALSHCEREILLYEILAGLNQREIGDILGLSKPTICKIRKGAIAKLRAITEAEGV